MTMRMAILALAMLTGCAGIPARDPALPDPALTPGAVDPHVTSSNIDTTVCVPGYTKHVRPPARFTSALKRAQMSAWHLSGAARDYEEDHLIPLELGAAPADARNLWPEPRHGAWNAAVKDRLENRLHALVCRRALDLTTAQGAIASDWTSAYVTYYGADAAVGGQPPFTAMR
ncbi:MAG TPA: hypothetical protein VGM17_02165 [Rhizomicrobium sp.]|jgi:hypothetical protein